MILLVYCLIAALVCVGLAAMNTHSLLETHSTLTDSRLAASNTSQVAEAAGAIVRELESNQRHNRAEFSSEEAIEASYAIQQAKAAHEQAQKAARQAQEYVDALERTARTAQIRYVPLAALLITHLLGAAFFKPSKA